ncbi:hypothetical protein GW17_00048936 [Ensete ventricosum]|nr:hypothetical protein GW17_00048936 [Ensete ventricosum]RZS24226.1 hypothetical protein BHM03_00057278 [Ensete ventricosum]
MLHMGVTREWVGEDDKVEDETSIESSIPCCHQGRALFDYSTTATKSNWEPRGVLQPEQKIKDLAKGEKMQHLQRLQRGRRRNK